MRKTFTYTFRLVLIVLVILGFGLLNSFGQEFSNGVMQGTIRIKIRPAIASSVEAQSMSKGMVSTGVKALDKLNKTYSVTSMKRVFPYSPKFEGRHMKHGLHLWYELTIGAQVASTDVVRAYSKLQDVDIAEPVHEAILVDGSGKPTYVSAPVKSPFAASSSRNDTAYFNDPYLKKQWHYNNTGQTGGTPGADINLFNAWGITNGKPNVIVSIHDQGVDYKHEDLVANMWVNEAEKNGQPGVDDDGNGYIDDINGFNFSNNSGAIDIQYHATHVAGTIAATNNNGIGVCGIAGGTGTGDGARVMTCQILGGAHAANIPLSYVFAADNGAVISQNSWGYSEPGTYDQAVNDGIDYFIAEAGNYPGSPMKGGVVIFAAGNSNTEEMMYPGAYSHVISVSALDAFATRAGYSNYGTWVNIAAPGGESEDNALPGSNTNYSNGIMSTLDKNGYGYLDGTSMACPHVSGVAALVVSKYGGPDFTNTALRNHLITGVNESIYANPDNAAMIGKLGTGETDAVLALAQDNKIAPNKITDLKLEGIAQDFASLSWSVPADEDDGKPLSFEVIYSTKEITEATMAYAKIITIKNKGAVGTKMDFEVPYLQAVTRYYFSLRGIDRWGNTADFSNSISATTNSGPTASFDPSKPSLNISINVTQKTVGSDSINLLNSGEGILVWDANPRHVDAVPLSVKPALNYPKILDASTSPKGIKSQSLSPEILNNIQHDTMTEKGYVDQTAGLMVFGETNTKIPNSEATRFYVDEENGFNLTYVDAYLQHDPTTGPMILEIYEGADISSAKLLLAQEVAKSTDPSFTGINLNEELFFEKGTYFWVVIHVPAGNKYPLGGGLELSPEYSKNCYISLNGGQTWKMFEELYYDNQVVWAVFAMSRSVALAQYVTLNPVSGKVYPSGDTTIVATVNAANMINGTYKANLVVNTNETGKPIIRVPVNITIQGHKPKITSIGRANFGNILVGTSKDLVVTFNNTGLGRFTFKAPQYTISNPQFTYLNGISQNFEAATSMNLTFRYTATTVGNNYCQVTLIGENGETYNFELFGAGMDVPVVKINPQTATYNNLAIGDSIKGNFSLKNEGKYPLDYYMPAFADGSNMETIPANVHKFGYSVKVDTTGASFVWDDIAGRGKDVTDMFPGNGDNNIYKQFPLAFLFPFFGKNENFVYISKYGLVSFDDHDYIWSSQPVQYKNAVNPDRYISAAGFPMLFEEAGFGHIYYKQEPDKFIVQFDNVPYWDGITWTADGVLPGKSAMTFQIVLHDNGNIRMYYKANSMQPRDYATNLVAIEDQTKNDGLLINGFERNKYDQRVSCGTFKPGTAILINNPGLGLFSNISKPYGTVFPNDSVRITYTIKTDSLSVLPYTENLVIISNDPYTNPTIHTAAFNIVSGGVSDIHIDSTELKFGTLFKGAQSSISFLISNYGKATDSLLTAKFDNNYFTLTGDVPSLLKPERSLPFTVTAKTQSIGVFNDTLRFTTKNGQSFKIGISLEVIQGPIITLLNSASAPLSSVTKFLNAGANTTVNFKIKNTGGVDLHVAPANNDWSTISETVPSASAESVMYKWKKSTEFGGPVYDWVEIVGNPDTKKITDIDTWNAKDFSAGVKMPFPFKFYGKEYDTMYIGMGLVTFTPGQNGSGTFWGGRPIPDTARPNNYIAPLWVFGGPDWVVIYPDAGIYYQLFDDKIIVEFRDINSAFTMGDPISYEAILYKNGNIKYQYVMPTATTNTVTDHGSIGIENETGTDGVLISLYQKVVNQNMAITLYPAHMYTVPPAQTKDFKMLLDAKDLIEGSYADSIAFTNNDSNALNLTLPTKLVITGSPQIEIPAPIVYDTVLVNPAVPTAIKEFEVKNTGTANFTLNGITQLVPNDVVVETYEIINNTWTWTKLSNFAFPVTLKAHSAMKFRATVTPLMPEVLLDTMVLTTSLTPASYKIPITANIYDPAVMSLGTDTISFYAQTSAFKATEAVKIGNEIGGLNLLYDLSINFQREVPATLAAGTSASKAIVNTTRKADTLPSMTAMEIHILSTGKSQTTIDEYNRVLSWDSDTVAQTRLGYNGSRAFYTATGFTAPASGFLLSHVQTWFVPSDWLNSKIKVMVLAGDEDINNCKTLLEASFEHNITETDDKGSMLTYHLPQSVDINPNEKFYVVFGYEAALTYPQGCATKTEIVKNRFLFGAPEDWYELADYAQFNTIGWMTRAIEETSGDIPWVVLSSATNGVLEPAQTDSIHFSFTARTAPNDDNIAYLLAKSNDIANPEKRIVLRLIKNKGPVFEDQALPLVVSENDSIAFQVSTFDQEGDSYTTVIDSAYSLLKSMPYTDPDPKVKTLKYMYKPDFKSQGVHRFSFTGTDEFNNVSKSTVSVTVKNVNRPPVSITTDTLNFAPQGDYRIVTANDVFTDPDDDMQTLEAVTGDTEILNMFVSGNSFLLMPGMAGETSVTFMVTDKYGAKATNTIPVKVSDEYMGIREVKSRELFIYPNPTKGEVNVIMPSDLNGKTLLAIYNAQGVLVKEENFNANVTDKFSFDMTDLPAGIYFLKWNNSLLQKSGKIIKQ